MWFLLHTSSLVPSPEFHSITHVNLAFEKTQLQLGHHFLPTNVLLVKNNSKVFIHFFFPCQFLKSRTAHRLWTECLHSRFSGCLNLHGHYLSSRGCTLNYLCLWVDSVCYLHRVGKVRRSQSVVTDC